jgi:tetratricopeptide (TPR) repeat protein
VYAATGDTRKVADTWRRVIELDPNNLQAYEMLGRFYISQGELEAARAQFETMAERRPRDVGTQTMVALLLAAQNKRAEARVRYERILEMEPRAGVAANNLAWIYADGDDSLDRALELAQTARAALPNEPSVADTLAWVYYRKNLPASAIPLLRLAIDRAPQDPIYHYHLGLVYAKTGDKAQARQSLERALRLDPRFPGADDARRALATL